MESIKEMYFAETTISTAFDKIKDKIVSPKLEEILINHHKIHLRHLDRLKKIFEILNESMEIKSCEAIIALLEDSNKHFTVFSGDIANWEIALILVSQKLAHYKIASYGAVAHLAINLNYHRAATLLAVCVQEEEEYIQSYLNGITHEFLKPYH